MSLRAIARATLETTLVGTGVTSVARGRMRGRALVLAYHNIVPTGERAVGDRSLHLTQERFAAQLDALLKTHDIVPLDSLLEDAEGKRPRIAITFDDAYTGAVIAGVEVLRSRGLPATIFVTPEFVGGGSFWWDLIAHPESGLAPEARAHALECCRGEQDRVLAWARAEGLPSQTLPEHARCASETDIALAVGSARIAIGSHTWSHANLAQLSGEELHAELRRPKAWLDARFPARKRWLSYPYGHRNAETEQAALAAGYEGAFLIEGGWTAPVPGAPSRLPRLNVPAGMTAKGLSIRAAGLLCS
jgi:peptidoglycan/xylan/chitin deacetylase (PgdA/CDA1 family)